MEAVICLAAFLGLVAIIVFAVVRPKVSETRDDHLERVAASLGGQIQDAPALGIRFVRFERNGVPYLYCTYQHAGTWITALEACAGSHAYLDALSLQSRRSPPHPPGTQVVGADPEFVVRTLDPEWGTRLILSGLRDFLRDFRIAAPGPAHVRLTQARIILEIERLLLPTGAVALAGAMDRLLVVLRSVADPSGVEILDMKDVDGATCRICGVPLGPTVVRCRLCRRPHHADCWEYLGRCSTYGCAGTDAD